MKKYIYLLSAVCLGLFASCSKSDDFAPINEGQEQQQELRSLRKIKSKDEVTLKNWMAALPDELPIRSISIPGTHDSGANKYVGIATRWTQTQELSFRQQLDNGIRFFDVRVSLENGKLELRHGSVRLGYNLQKDVLNAAHDFLKENPSETIIMTVKNEYREYRGMYSKNFEDRLYDEIYYNDARLDSLMIRDYNSDMTLGRARGQILIFSRNREFSGPAGYIQTWYDNRTFDTSIHYEKAYKSDLYVEDQYKVSIGNKISISKEYINTANRHFLSGNKALHIGFTSSSGPLNISWPNVTSGYINPEVTKYLRNNKDIRYCGILVNNYAKVNDELTKAIIDLNHRH